MQSKYLLIAIAAMAVTASGAQAYTGNKGLSKAGLSSHQIEAFTQARELRSKGEVEKARNLLMEAGVDQLAVNFLKKDIHSSRQKLKFAVETGNYGVFKEVIENTSLADIVTTEEDFLIFKEVYTLKQAGEFEKAKELLDGLGLSVMSMRDYMYRQGYHADRFLELTPEQHDALRVARQANDYMTVKAILTEVGIEDVDSHPRVLKKEWQ